mmetsp:Transcript_14008/g.48735  ORF Transcript_14008/g.48735 Transcript_14008/m.48735 type:complete len:227 (+) Transcript_14008:331-1011(+)
MLFSPPASVGALCSAAWTTCSTADHASLAPLAQSASGASQSSLVSPTAAHFASCFELNALVVGPIVGSQTCCAKVAVMPAQRRAAAPLRPESEPRGRGTLGQRPSSRSLIEPRLRGAQGPGLQGPGLSGPGRGSLRPRSPSCPRAWPPTGLRGGFELLHGGEAAALAREEADKGDEHLDEPAPVARLLQPRQQELEDRRQVAVRGRGLAAQHYGAEERKRMRLRRL